MIDVDEFGEKLGETLRSVEVTVKLTIHENGITQLHSTCIAHDYSGGIQHVSKRVTPVERARIEQSVREVVCDFNRD